MNVSTIIGLKIGGTAAAAWFAAAFILINLGLRAEYVLLILGLASLPLIAVVASRAAYAAGKQERASATETEVTASALRNAGFPAGR